MTTQATTPQKSTRVPRNMTSHNEKITLASKPKTKIGTVNLRLTPMRWAI